MNTNNIQAQAVPKYMVSRKFAEYTGIPYRIVLEMIKTGELEGFKSGRGFYILVESYKRLAHSMATE